MNLNSVVLKTTKKDDELVGSTAVVLNSPTNSKLLIVGGMNISTIRNPYLNVKLFSLDDYEYKPCTINTNGALNTMFHATHRSRYKILSLSIVFMVLAITTLIATIVE